MTGVMAEISNLYLSSQRFTLSYYNQNQKPTFTTKFVSIVNPDGYKLTFMSDSIK